MAESTFWWLLAGVAVGIELLTGTFYLLMLAIGFAAAALAGHFGLSLTTQLVLAAVVGGGAVVAWHLVRQGRPAELPAEANPDVNMDIGGTVQVLHWLPDGTAHVKYRGAQWTAVMVPGAIPVAGPHRIREVVGSRLVLEQLPES